MPSNTSRNENQAFRFLDTSSKELFSGSFNIRQIGKLGSGHTSTVSRCVCYHNGERLDIAVKAIAKGKTSRRMATREVGILRRCQEKNVVRFEDAYECSDSFMIITECCEQGDLFGVLKRLNDAQICEYMTGIVEGLASLHQKLVAHCDIKMRNILITANNVIKIADFGFAVHLSSVNDTIKHLNGTEDYWGPEMKAEPICFNPFIGDIFALGVTFMGMIERRAIKRKNDDIYEIARSYQDIPLQKMMLGMLNCNPGTRWTITQVKNCEWIKDVTPPPSPT